MSDTAVKEQELYTSEQIEELRQELEKREKDDNNQQEDFDKQEKKLTKKRRNKRIFMIVMILLIVLMLIIKYVIYFKPEKIQFDNRVQMISEVNPETEDLQVMPFNEDLIVACQPILIADSRDNSVQFDFISPESCKVLVRAEIYTAKENLNQKPIKLFLTDIFYPNDESMVRIASTGWIRPGEMISTIKLDELPYKMSDATVRFVAVNPANQKISSGIFSMNTVLHIVDYNGNMLDENGNWVSAG